MCVCVCMFVYVRMCASNYQCIHFHDDFQQVCLNLIKILISAGNEVAGDDDLYCQYLYDEVSIRSDTTQCD